MYSKDKIMATLHEIKEESETVSPYVVIAQPRRNNTEKAAQIFQGYGLNHIDLVGYSLGYVDCIGEKIDVARNYLMEQVIAHSGAKYMLFIGDDTILPYDAFTKLHATAEANPDAVVVGVYYMKCGGPMIMTKNKENQIIVPNVDPGQLFEAFQTGMDAMLIPVSILKKLKDADPDLPFCCVAQNIPGIPFVGEDNFFVYRLRKAGFRLLVNTDVQCIHADIATGKYTAHKDINLNDYYTNIQLTDRLTIRDKKYIDARWTSRLPDGTTFEVEPDSKHVAKAIPDILKSIVGRDNTSIKALIIGPDAQENIDFIRKNVSGDLTVYKEDDPAITDDYLDFVFTTEEMFLGDRATVFCDKYYSKVKPTGFIAGKGFMTNEPVKAALAEFSKTVDKSILVAENDLWYIAK